MAEQHTSEEPKRKRNRISLNCLSCKSRKIKCDRQMPCSSCVKGRRNCEYQQPLWNQQSESKPDTQFQVQRLDVQPPHEEKEKFDSSVFQQLNFLKDKIQQLESGMKEHHRLEQRQQQQQSGTESESPVSHEVQHKTAHNGTKFTSSDELRKRTQSSKDDNFIGFNPYSSDTETINFYQGYNSVHNLDSSRQCSFGPFAWLSLMKKDPSLYQMWKYVRQNVTKHVKKETEAEIESQLSNIASENSAKSGISLEKHTDKEFLNKARERMGLDAKLLERTSHKTDNLKDTVIQNCTKHNPKACLARIAAMNKHGLPLGLTVFEGKINQELKLIEKISMVLPSQKVVWTLINKFFDKVYPFVPILDESSFKKEMTRILGDEAMSESRLELKVEKRLDFAYLGALLIILRLTYLSLFSNRNGVNENNLNTEDTSPKAQELKYLLSNPINITLIDLAQACLEQFEIFRKINLAVLQCAFLLRLYRMFAPEDGDGADGGDSQTYNGMLIQMAYSMGINREPTKNVDDSTNEVVDDIKTNNVQRKIWFFLVICDLIQAYKYGNPLCINEKSYDTSLPFYKPGNENIKDVELEQHVIGTFAYFEKYYHKLLAILEATLDIERQIKLSELTPLITEFEVFLHEAFGNLKLFLVPFDKNSYKYPFVKIMKCKIYIAKKMFLNLLFFHLYLYYEKQGNVDFAYFYLRKVYSSIVGEFFPCLFQLLDDNQVNFGDMADLILNPTVLSMIHACSHFNSSTVLRLGATIHEMRQQENFFSRMRSDPSLLKFFTTVSQLERRLIKVSEFFVAAMSRLSERYFHAWKVTKVHGFIINYYKTGEFYQKNDKLNKFLNLSLDQFKEFNDFIGDNLKKYSKSKEIQEEVKNTTESNTIDTPKEMETPSIFFLPPENSNTLTDQTQPNPSTIESISDDADWLQEFNIVNNIEIDNMWKSLTQMKQASSDGDNDFSSNDNKNGFSPTSEVTIVNNDDIGNSGVLEDLDFFNSIPFETYFGTSGQS